MKRQRKAAPNDAPACEIACLGILVADTVGVTVDNLPPRGTLVPVERVELHVGGCGANTSLALAKLGISVSLLGKVGADNLGRFVRRTLLEQHVNLMGGVVSDANAATGATIVLVHSDAQRSFLTALGANASFAEADVNWNQTRGAKVFHVAGPQLMPKLEGKPLARILQEAQTRGMTTVLDTVMNPRSMGWDGLAPGLPHLDWAIPSFEEAELLTGEATPEAQAQRFKEGGAKNVAVKLSKNGCFVSPQTGADFVVPAIPVRALDSLGAGDCWAAGFLLGLLRGWDIEKVARFANAVGACSVQAVGATTGVLTEAETLALLDATRKP